MTSRMFVALQQFVTCFTFFITVHCSKQKRQVHAGATVGGMCVISKYTLKYVWFVNMCELYSHTEHARKSKGVYHALRVRFVRAGAVM